MGEGGAEIKRNISQLQTDKEGEGNGRKPAVGLALALISLCSRRDA